MPHGDALFEPVLATLVADRSTLFGAPGAELEIVRRIDGAFSSVCQVNVRHASHTTSAYLKILKPRRPGQEESDMIDRMLKREYLATRALHEALDQDRQIGAVRPLAWLPEHRALVTEEAQGRPLGELLTSNARSAGELAAVAGRVGRWIRTYQSLVQTSESVAVVAFDERRAYVDVRLAGLVGRVLSPAERQAALARFDALVREIGTATVPAVAIHADLNPLNIIVQEDGRVTVIDFTMAKAGTIYHDLSHLYFHLALGGARHRRRRQAYAEMRRALLEGYAPGLSPGDSLFRLMMLVHGVCHVALLAERRVPVVDAAYRWFMKRRWKACERLQEA